VANLGDTLSYKSVSLNEFHCTDSIHCFNNEILHYLRLQSTVISSLQIYVYLHTGRSLERKLATLKVLMGNIGKLFPLTDNTDGTAVDQVQQQDVT